MCVWIGVLVSSYMYLLTRESVFPFGIALIGRMFLYMWFMVKLCPLLALCNCFLFKYIPGIYY